MKTILTCLLGIAMLLGQPAWATTPKTAPRIIRCYEEDHILIATSDSEDGHIVTIMIYNLNGPTLALEDEFYSYSCQMDIAGLKSGHYQAKIFTENAPVHSEFFTVQ